jgi:hypothetical protein
MSEHVECAPDLHRWTYAVGEEDGMIEKGASYNEAIRCWLDGTGYRETEEGDRAVRRGILFALLYIGDQLYELRQQQQPR